MNVPAASPDRAPKPDRHPSGSPAGSEPGTQPSAAKRLVFRPDERQAARLKAIRRGLMYATMVFLGIAIVSIALYRPVMRMPNEGSPVPAVSDSRPEAGGERQFAILPKVLPGAESREPGPGTPVRSPGPPGEGMHRLAAGVRNRAAGLQSFHQRAVELLPRPPFGPAAAAAAFDRLRDAQVLLDSIGLGLAELRRLSGQLETAAAGLDASRRYDASVVRDALDRVRTDMEARHRELKPAVANLTQAAEAAAAGDAATAEIKSGVASSYLLQSDRRSRAVGRRLEALQAAVRRLEDRPGGP